MEVITSITNQPRQRFNIKLDNNEQVIIRLYYCITQKAWYFDFQYNDYICNGNKVVLSFNALRHLRKKLPFGIAFLSESCADPCDLNDFQNENAYMVLLNQADVEEFESKVYEQ